VAIGPAARLTRYKQVNLFKRISFYIDNQPVKYFLNFYFEQLLKAPIFAVPKRTGV